MAKSKRDPAAPPHVHLTQAQVDLTDAKAFVLNSVGLTLATGLVGGIAWVVTHLGEVFG